MAETEQKTTREARIPWPDRWLLDALRQQGHPAVDRLQPANSAWEAVVAAGASQKEVLDLVCSLAGAAAANLASVGAPEALLLSRPLARRYGVVPLRQSGPVLEVACSNPLLPHLARDLAFAAARQIRVTIASPGELRIAHERVYGGGKVVAAPTSRIEWVVKEGPLGPRAMLNRGQEIGRASWRERVWR